MYVLQIDGHSKVKGSKLRQRPFPEPQNPDEPKPVQLDGIQAYDPASVGEGKGLVRTGEKVDVDETESEQATEAPDRYGPAVIVELSSDG